MSVASRARERTRFTMPIQNRVGITVMLAREKSEQRMEQQKAETRRILKGR